MLAGLIVRYCTALGQCDPSSFAGEVQPPAATAQVLPALAGAVVIAFYGPLRYVWFLNEIIAIASVMHALARQTSSSPV
jgi:hypothetical protein